MDEYVYTVLRMLDVWMDGWLAVVVISSSKIFLVYTSSTFLLLPFSSLSNTEYCIPGGWSEEESTCQPHYYYLLTTNNKSWIFFPSSDDQQKKKLEYNSLLPRYFWNYSRYFPIDDVLCDLLILEMFDCFKTWQKNLWVLFHWPYWNDFLKNIYKKNSFFGTKLYHFANTTLFAIHSITHSFFFVLAKKKWNFLRSRSQWLGHHQGLFNIFSPLVVTLSLQSIFSIGRLGLLNGSLGSLRPPPW